MDAKKCDRCGLFYIRKNLKTDNAVDIFGMKVFNVILNHRSDDCDFDYCTNLDLCPKCMNELKIFMEENKGDHNE